MYLGFNYFTIGAFILTFFNFLISINFIFRKNSKFSTKVLSYFFIIFLPTNFSYFFASTIVHPIMAYYRWFTVPSVFFSYCFLIYFFLIFRESIESKINIIYKIILYLMLIYSLFISFYFYINSYDASKIFVFTGHNYELVVPNVNKFVFNSLISFFILMFLALIYKTFRLPYLIKSEKGKYKDLSYNIFLLWILFLTQLLPTITNILSANGKFNRGFHYLIFVLTIVIGFFVTFILFLNIEKEETSLLFKISGISTVTILVLTQLISYIMLRDLENNFLNLYNLKYENFFNRIFNEYDKKKLKELINQKVDDVSTPIIIFDFKKNELVYYNENKITLDDVNKITQDQKKDKIYYQNKNLLLIKFILNNNIEIYIDYKILREFMHEKSYRIFLFILIFSLLTSLFFPIFIKIEFISSIEELSRKIHIVDEKKNYNIEVKKFYNDQIGVLTDTFNKMIRDLKNSYDQLKEYSLELEKKVAIKTAELNEQLSIIKTIKEKQEGDYYLFSLLLKPLVYNQIHSNYLKIQHFLRQSRIYEFKNRKGEIGGDNIIYDRIYMFDKIEGKVKSYLIFSINDALGLSLQGAFGSLIYSLILKWYISTLKYEIMNQKISELIYDCYYVLNRIFSFFKGEMTCSSIIGIIDELSYEYHYINIDFPHMVIIRRNRNNFIEVRENSDWVLSPLGRESQKGIKIHRGSLNKEETLIFSSDGIQKLDLINTQKMDIINFLQEYDYDINLFFQDLNRLNILNDDIAILSLERKDNYNQNKQYHYHDLVSFTLYLIRKKQMNDLTFFLENLERNHYITMELLLSYAIYYYFNKKYSLSKISIDYIIKNHIKFVNDKNYLILYKLIYKLYKITNDNMYIDYLLTNINNDEQLKQSRIAKLILNQKNKSKL